MRTDRQATRRSFLRGTVGTAVGGWAAIRWPRRVIGQTAAAPATGLTAPSLPPSQAALLAGDSRADNVFRALKLIEPQVRQAIARKKRVLIKPNVVVTNNQLSATHVECLEGILEFLNPIVKDEIVIGDSSAGGQVTAGYDNYKYHSLANRYRVRFIDLDEMPTETRYVVDHRYLPQPVRLAQPVIDPETFIISAAVPKTHDRAVCTLSLKNVVVGAAIKDKGFRWGAKGTGSNDKVLIHGGPENQAIHYNLFNMAKMLRPDLSVLDGYQGMERNGPVAGTAVDHRIAIASTDFLAADRIGVELMGFDFAQVGYLTFCARAGLGQGDLTRIEVLGERITDHQRKYRPHDTIEQQLKWMTRGT
ncbi:MAG: DUF362 domain-containing protein [Planctomycetes bacterium]|nr:DUF362 domain-containing protein [Planctomycetota bacterium]